MSNTPIKDGVLTGSPVVKPSATLTIQGSLVMDTGSTLSLLDNSVGWGKVSKSGSSIADLATRNAADVTNVPSGGIVSTNVQAALNELDTELTAVEQTLTALVTNAEAVPITRGQVVYLFGASGDRATVKLAYNTSDATSAKTFGVVKDASIAANGTGYVTCQGVVTNVNLGSFTAGQAVYLGATAGSITATKPSAPNHLVYVGIVERANSGNGQLYVRIQNGYELDEIHDVAISSPTTGQTIVFNSSTSLWNNSNAISLIGGSVESSPIGASSPSTGAFTTLSASGNLTVSGASYLLGNSWFNLGSYSGTRALNFYYTGTNRQAFISSTGGGNFNGDIKFGVNGSGTDTDAVEVARINSVGLHIGPAGNASAPLQIENATTTSSRQAATGLRLSSPAGSGQTTPSIEFTNSVGTGAAIDSIRTAASYASSLRFFTSVAGGDVPTLALTLDSSQNATLAGNLTVSGGTVDITSASFAKISSSTAGSSAALSLISNLAANYRSLQFGYGSTPTYLWKIGYQGATSNDQLNFESGAGTVAQLTQAGALTLSGNLTVSGTGTSTFGGPLTVSLAQNADTALRVTNSDSQASARAVFLMTGQGSSYGTYVNNTYVRNYTAAALDMQWWTSGIQRATLNASGNLLIGTTSDGGQKLQVAGTGLFSTTEPTITLSSTAVGSIAYQLISGGGSGHTLGAFKIYDSSTGYVVLNHDKPTSGGTRLSFDGAGNTTLAGNLTVSGGQIALAASSSTPSVLVTQTDSGAYSIVRLRNTGGTAQSYEFGVGGSGTGSLAQKFYIFDNTAFATRLAIAPTSGNVLIGTTTDGGQKLQVAGDAALTGNLTVSGTGGITSSSISPLFKATSSALGSAPKLTLENTNLGAWNVYLSGTDGGDFKIDQDSTNKFRIAYGTGNATLAGNLTVSGTGTSSFAGTVNSTVGLRCTATNSNLSLYKDGTPSKAARVILNGSVADGLSLGLYNGTSWTDTLHISTNNNVLLGTTTDSGNGKLQLATHTTSAGGIGFGTDTALYRYGAGRLGITHIGGSTPILYLLEGTTETARLWTASGPCYLDTLTAQPIYFRPNGTTALTLDSSQNATFAGKVGIGGASVAASSLILRGLSITTGATQSGVDQQTTFNSDATTGGRGISSVVVTKAASFTMANGAAFYAVTPVLGSGSAITTNTGLYVANQGATGITNAYGIDIAAQSGAATTNIGLRNLGATVLLTPASAVTLADNSTMTFELTSNTSLTIKVRGTDGTTRSVALTLS